MSHRNHETCMVGSAPSSQDGFSFVSSGRECSVCHMAIEVTCVQIGLEPLMAGNLCGRLSFELACFFSFIHARYGKACPQTPVVEHREKRDLDMYCLSPLFSFIFLGFVFAATLIHACFYSCTCSILFFSLLGIVYALLKVMHTYTHG